MAYSADEFWEASDSDDDGRPLLTDAALAEAEQTLGVTLPAEYVQLLRMQNGGTTVPMAYPMAQRTSWSAVHVPLFELFGIQAEDAGVDELSILDTPYLTAEWDLPPRQVLLSGEGHWWITLDYRRGAQPSVAWIDVEVGEDLQIAPTFIEFLNGLVPASAFERDGPAASGGG